MICKDKNFGCIFEKKKKYRKGYQGMEGTPPKIQKERILERVSIAVKNRKLVFPRFLRIWKSVVYPSTLITYTSVFYKKHSIFRRICVTFISIFLYLCKMQIYHGIITIVTNSSLIIIIIGWPGVSKVGKLAQWPQIIGNPTP